MGGDEMFCGYVYVVKQCPVWCLGFEVCVRGVCKWVQLLEYEGCLKGLAF